MEFSGFHLKCDMFLCMVLANGQIAHWVVIVLYCCSVSKFLNYIFRDKLKSNQEQYNFYAVCIVIYEHIDTLHVTQIRAWSCS